MGETGQAGPAEYAALLTQYDVLFRENAALRARAEQAETRVKELECQKKALQQVNAELETKLAHAEADADQAIHYETTRAEQSESVLRSIAGAVGEFADADGKNIVEKIEFLRKDYEERIEKAEGALCRAREWLVAAKTLNGTECIAHDPIRRKRVPSVERCGKCILCLIDYAMTVHLASAPCPHEEEARRLREALNISPDEVGRIMHESWTRTKRAQGFHHQSECYAMDRYESNGPCPKCHSDLIPWEQLPEGQKDINRHAFDDVLTELRRRVEGR